MRRVTLTLKSNGINIPLSFMSLDCFFHAELSSYFEFFVWNRQTSKVYIRTIEKGVAFPTCVSVNNTVCHFSPLAADKSILEENDIVKM